MKISNLKKQAFFILLFSTLIFSCKKNQDLKVAELPIYKERFQKLLSSAKSSNATKQIPKADTSISFNFSSYEEAYNYLNALLSSKPQVDTITAPQNMMMRNSGTSESSYWLEYTSDNTINAIKWYKNGVLTQVTPLSSYGLHVVLFRYDVYFYEMTNGNVQGLRVNNPLFYFSGPGTLSPVNVNVTLVAEDRATFEKTVAATFTINGDSITAVIHTQGSIEAQTYPNSRIITLISSAAY